jgi:membrane protein
MKRQTALAGPDAGPRRPWRLSRAEWGQALRRTAGEFNDDAIPDRAAALTYYCVLSIFPGLVVLVSIVGLLGQSTVDNVRDTITGLVPGPAGQVLSTAITHVRSSGPAAGVLAIVGVLVAFWSASGYIAAFMRAANAIYDVPEGRPVWKTLPIRIALTAVLGLLLIASTVIVVFTGQLAQRLGDLIGVGSTAVTVWGILKWPVLIVLISLMVAILYRVSPNARQGGLAWVSPGGLIAVVLWLVASGAFAIYVSHFGSYNKTYGTLASAVVFLVWLWLSNMAILLGAEIDAELERGRALAAGYPAKEEPYLQLRDDRKVKPEQLHNRQ